MRNLKKILALVLALIMSLSLMATAGATDFKDDENISDTYRQAAQVLSELGVFNGDQNGQFNPEQPITRAEVAAILYRIATGDIGLEGNKTYAPYNQFPDVAAEDWYAGYVTYCANAGYIKGRNTGKFDAKDNVTGYEVLAMILRAVGYDKNNEFVGSDWQLHTASIAREKGVLRNVLEDPNVQLSNPATREVVAELLFRASLLPQVSWNAASLSYVENGETLAYENLGMEQVEGVVIANEWADLRDDDVTAANQTVLNTADGERTLAVPTDLTDIGESRYAYVVGTKVLGQLEDTGKNVTKDCADLDPAGSGTYVSTLADGLDVKDAEYYVNFSYGTKDTSEYRIEYSVSFRNDEAKEWFESKYLGQNEYNDVDLAKLAADDNEKYDRGPVDSLTDTGVNTYYEIGGATVSGNELGRTFSRVIPAGETISNLDKAIMQGIFGSAASFDSKYDGFDKLSDDIIHAGYVYAGSKSNPNTTDTKDDLSDDRTYQQFADEYIGTDATSSFAYNYNGEWLKIIDNDNDGKAEYVLDTMYDLFEVVAYNERTDVYDFSRTDTDSDDAVCRDSEYEFVVGDMLLGAWIDGQYVVEEAKSEIVIIDKYSWKDESVTTRDGAVLYASGANINNTTGYAEELANMQYGVEYEVFYDHYGFIRAYRPVDSDRKYGLLTDLYLNDYNNTHYIRSQVATVELSFVEEDGKLNMNEYQVANHDGYEVINPFVGVRQYVNTSTNRTDNLQRAIAHLDMSYVNAARTTVICDTPTVNTASGWYAGSDLGDEFDYDGVPSIGETQSTTLTNGTDPDTDKDTNIQYSATNVARYILNEDGTVTLNTVAEFAYNKANEQLFYWKDNATYAWGSNPVTNRGIGGTRMTAADWAKEWAASTGETVQANINAALAACLKPVYAVDYVMLDTTNDGASTISSTTYRFKIDDSYDNGTNLYNWHVNAVKDTLFYVVTSEGVFPYVGYQNLPTINTSEINAMYAVAQSVTLDGNGTDYWVADVVVIEAENLATVYGHMVYNVYDNYRQNQRGVIHELDVIDCVTGELTTAIVDSSWTQPYDTGFYLLQDAEVAEDGTITASGMITVEKHKADNSRTYSSYGILAGEVVRSNSITSRDSYIEIYDEWTDVPNNGDERKVQLNGAPWYSIHGYYTEANKTAGRFTATQLSDRDYTGNQPNGDEVIYVTYNNKVVFVIDTYITTGIYEAVPAYLNDYDRDFADNVDINSVYERAIIEQTSIPAGDQNIVFDLGLVEGQTITFTYEDKTNSYDHEDAQGVAPVPAGRTGAVIRVKLTGVGATIDRVTTNSSSGWRVVAVKAVTGEANTYDIEVVKDSIFARSGEARTSDTVGGIYTTQYVTTLKNTATAIESISDADEMAEAKAIQAELADLLAASTLVVAGSPVEISTTKTTLDSKIASGADTVAAAELVAAKTAANDAITDLLATKPGAAEQGGTLSTTKAALTAAIAAADTAAKLELIWKDGAFVATNETVKAFTDALAAYTPSNLAVEKDNALKAAAALVADKQTELDQVDVPAVGTAKTALDTAINECADEAALGAIWNGKSFVATQAEVKALTDALATVDAALEALTTAKTTANETVDTYLTEENAEKLSAEQKATLATAKTEAVAAIEAAKTTAAVTTAVNTYKDAVDEAVADASKLSITVSGTGVTTATVKVDPETNFTELNDIVVEFGANYDAPSTITVAMGGTTLVKDTDYTWDDSQKTIGFKGDKTVTDDITITVVGVRQTVAVSISDSNLEITPATINKGDDLAGKTLTIKVESSAAGSKGLPDDITSITLNGQAIASSAYSYDKTTGVITFDSEYDGTATGAIVVTADAT